MAFPLQDEFSFESRLVGGREVACMRPCPLFDSASEGDCSGNLRLVAGRRLRRRSGAGADLKNLKRDEMVYCSACVITGVVLRIWL
jgi:hypothetical protein